MVKCQKCGYEWIPRLEQSRICPKCKTLYWNKGKEKKNYQNIDLLNSKYYAKYILVLGSVPPYWFSQKDLREELNLSPSPVSKALNIMNKYIKKKNKRYYLDLNYFIYEAFEIFKNKIVDNLEEKKEIMSGQSLLKIQKELIKFKSLNFEEIFKKDENLFSMLKKEFIECLCQLWHMRQTIKKKRIGKKDSEPIKYIKGLKDISLLDIYESFILNFLEIINIENDTEERNLIKKLILEYQKIKILKYY